MEIVVAIIILIFLGKAGWWVFKNMVKGCFFLMLGGIILTIIMGFLAFTHPH